MSKTSCSHVNYVQIRMQSNYNITLPPLKKNEAECNILAKLTQSPTRKPGRNTKEMILQREGGRW
uniref:Uncharacterized protein n=1 Tax=Solanum tuberosum TaxID=4113 RepID=M1BHT2_SOLTU